MKYVIIMADGYASEALDSLDGKSPLESANTSAMDAIAKAGIVGAVNHNPSHFPADCSLQATSLLGYNPLESYTGPAPLVAVANDVDLADGDWCVQCDLVCVEDQTLSRCEEISEESSLLFESVQESADDSEFDFVSCRSHGLLVFHDSVEASPFSPETRATSPASLVGKSVAEDFPRGPGSDLLADLMSQSERWFESHHVNQERVAESKPVITNLWLWGLGQKPKISSFEGVHGIRGALVASDDSMLGLGRLAGLKVVEPELASGLSEKGTAAIGAIAEHDLVFVHARDVAVSEPVESIENVDKQVVEPIFEHLKSGRDDFRILVSCGDLFAICGSEIVCDGADSFCGKSSNEFGVPVSKGWDLMPFLLNGRRN